MSNAQIFEEPALAGVEIGSARWFEVQREIIASRPLVNATYERWYRAMLGDAATVAADGKILEIGSGSGYVKRLDPDVVTSDIVPGHSDMVVDARQLPFADASLKAILLTHVFHHVPDIRRFLCEADRTLVPGGVVTMIDVAHTPLSRLVFGHFHPERYDARAEDWALPAGDSYGGANQALSWIVFRRDRARFAREFPGFAVETIEYLPWFGYLLSGGATRRDLVPRFAVGLVRSLDEVTEVMNPLCALHWHICLRKTKP
jgi:SAM-dependent methyltransferase